MGFFKNVIEPAGIVLFFTLGTVVNRRSQRAPPRKSGDSDKHWYPEWAYSVADARDIDEPCHQSLFNRFLSFFPFLLEIWYWLLTYWVYQIARAATAAVIRGDDAVWEKAQRHALSILSLEQVLGFSIELPFQRLILQNYPKMMDFFGHVYKMHIIVGVGFLAYAYTFFPIRTFQRIRRTIALDNALAFVILTMWRCAPPRLLPAEHGYVDILHKKPTIWSQNRWQLTIAAMPSLHFGTAGFISLCLWRFAPHRAIRYLAVFYPLAMLATIIATANHFLLDAIVGSLVPVVSWKYQDVMVRLRAMEVLFGRFLGIDRPPQTDPWDVGEQRESADGKSWRDHWSMGYTHADV